MHDPGRRSSTQHRFLFDKTTCSAPLGHEQGMPVLAMCCTTPVQNGGGCPLMPMRTGGSEPGTCHCLRRAAHPSKTWVIRLSSFPTQFSTDLTTWRRKSNDLSMPSREEAGPAGCDPSAGVPPVSSLGWAAGPSKEEPLLRPPRSHGAFPKFKMWDCPVSPVPCGCRASPGCRTLRPSSALDGSVLQNGHAMLPPHSQVPSAEVSPCV